METQYNPLVVMDRQSVLGQLKSTGSKDEDVLYAARSSLMSRAKFSRGAGTYVMILGGLLSLTIIGAFLGIPLLGIGWWMRRRGARNVQAVEVTYEEYIKGLGASQAQPRVEARTA